MSGRSVAKAHPAESTTVAAALALIIAYAFGVIEVDGNALVIAGTVVLGALPGVVTWFVERRRGMSG